MMDARIQALKLALCLITGNACIVQPGDTLLDVAERLIDPQAREIVGINAKARELAKLNNLANPDLIRDGEILITAKLDDNGRSRANH